MDTIKLRISHLVCFLAGIGSFAAFNFDYSSLKSKPVIEPVTKNASITPVMSSVDKQDVNDVVLDPLSDPLNKISEDFKVPNGIKLRTQFWFDIYTKHTSKDHVIHHSKYPWVKFEVVDTLPQYKNAKSALWYKNKKAQRFVKSRKSIIKKSLLSLARNPFKSKLTPTEKSLKKIMAKHLKPSKHNYRLAAKSIRTQVGQKDFFQKALKNSAKYLPEIEKIFASKNMPLEMTRIPFVESSFNEKAHSKVGASGIWQIMPRTGRQGLIINKFIDERNSPLKASYKAANLLRMNKKLLKNWPLAVTAYNQGVGNLLKAKRATKSSDISTIVNKYSTRAFGFASKNFYTSFLAALHAEKYSEQLFPGTDKEEALNVRMVKLKKSYRVKTIAKIYNVNLQQLLNLNLDLKKSIKRNRRIPKNFRIYLPGAADQKLSQNSAPIE